MTDDIRKLLTKQLELLCEESTKNHTVMEIVALSEAISKIASTISGC